MQFSRSRRAMITIQTGDRTPFRSRRNDSRISRRARLRSTACLLNRRLTMMPSLALPSGAGAILTTMYRPRWTAPAALTCANSRRCRRKSVFAMPAAPIWRGILSAFMPSSCSGGALSSSEQIPYLSNRLHQYAVSNHRCTAVRPLSVAQVSRCSIQRRCRAERECGGRHLTSMM